MVQGFDRIVLAVSHLGEAIGQYHALLGARAQPMGDRRAWLGLPNTVLELVEDESGAGHIQGLVLSDPAKGEHAQAVTNALGLSLALCDGRLTADFRQRHPGAQCTALMVDHLVLRTADAQACVDLFGGQLGIRLALDKTVPEWGGRMLFFRAGKLTLEVIDSGDKEKNREFFLGVGFPVSRCTRAGPAPAGDRCLPIGNSRGPKTRYPGGHGQKPPPGYSDPAD